MRFQAATDSTIIVMDTGMMRDTLELAPWDTVPNPFFVSQQPALSDTIAQAIVWGTAILLVLCIVLGRKKLSDWMANLHPVQFGIVGLPFILGTALSYSAVTGAGYVWLSDLFDAVAGHIDSRSWIAGVLSSVVIGLIHASPVALSALVWLKVGKRSKVTAP